MPRTASNMGTLIDQLRDKREERRALEEKISLVKLQYDEIEQKVMEAMDKESVSKSTGKKATASISESVVPNVTDWDMFHAYIGKMKYYHLLERRASVTGCRELFETKGSIPGVVPFTKRRLNLTNL